LVCARRPSKRTTRFFLIEHDLVLFARDCLAFALGGEDGAIV